ncbi:MAG TPA: hypothetical protein VKM94_18195 [Blastocatellia bacterium]|nr:hypothetical protein [Blastocatellia bacterium]
MMQVTLTPVNGAPQHMFGHYETPYGTYGPAVAMEAEHDVDMLSATSSNASGLGSAKYLQEPTE